jgi:hypothetical protein
LPPSHQEGEGWFESSSILLGRVSAAQDSTVGAIGERRNSLGAGDE